MIGHAPEPARLVCGCVRDPAGYATNLTWLTEDLAVGGRIEPDRIRHLAETDGIGAVVDLRAEEEDDPAHFAEHGLALLRLPTEDHAALSPRDLDEGIAFAAAQRAAGRTVLVHCQHGIGRSATLALAILVTRGMAPLAALRHAKDRRELVSPSPAQYEAWRGWLAARGTAPAAIPDFAAFKAVAYRHLAAAEP